MRRSPYKRHILVDPGNTFCNQQFSQEPTKGKYNPEVGSPDSCTCRSCLTLYYLHNPLIEGRIQRRAEQRAAYRAQQHENRIR